MRWEHTLPHASERDRSPGARAGPGGAGDSSPHRALSDRRPPPPHGLAAARCGACPGRRPPTFRLPSAPRKGRTREPAPGGSCGRPRLPGGLLVAGQLSGREGDVRTRKRSADAAGERPGSVGRDPAGRRAGPGLQTLRRQARWWRRLLLRLPQDPPRAGPRWRRSLHRVSCHPRNGPDHKRRGEDARAASGARKRVVEPDLAATPLPRPAPPESAGLGRGPPHGPSRLKGAGKVVCASAVACPRLPGKLLRRFACCCLRGA